MSDWKIVVPEATTNMVLNPSAETTGNYAAEAGTTVNLDTTYSRYGLYAYYVRCNANNEGIRLTTSALANAIHYATARVCGVLPAAWDWSMDNANWHVPTLIEQLDSDWALYGVQFPAAQCNGQTTFRIHQNGAGTGDFWLDGVQIEEKSYWTTYCDGDREGCEWNGAEHASTSTRSAYSRAGGRVQDLTDDYDFDIGGVIGASVASQTTIIDEYAILPGGELNAIKVHPRAFSLIGLVRGTSSSNLHSKMQALQDVVLPDAYPQDEDGWQPVKLRYEGATVHKEIDAHYEAGLEGDLQATSCYWQKAALRFLAEDPYWRQVGESNEATALDTNDSATFRVVAGRLRSTGQWDNLGPPNAAGTYTRVEDIVVGEDGIVYFGGNFLDFDNKGTADHIVSYNPQTSTWVSITGGGAANGEVNGLAVAADGTLYAVGQFTSIGGVAANRIAAYSAGAWSALGAGTDNTINGITIGLDGIIYVIGTFLNAGGAGANRVASWNGAAWSPLGVGLNNVGFALATHPNGDIYMGGSFTDIQGGPGGTYNRIICWDPSTSTWSALGTGMNNDVFKIAISSVNIVYAGGSFITAGGITCNRIAEWNGTAWAALDTGCDGAVYELTIAPDDILWVGGQFATAGGINLADTLARWNGASFAHVDIDVPGTPITYAIAHGDASPVTPQNYDVWIGTTIASGTCYYAGLAVINNAGTAPAYPCIIIERAGGTSAVLETIRNETTGKELLFNYSLLDGERLTIDLRPTQKSIVSSMFGPRPDAILANSDFGEFALIPGDNDVTSFVNVAGATITAWVEWQTPYRGYD